MLTSVKAFENEGKLTEAERRLIAAVRERETCCLSFSRPDTPTDANTIRAELLAVLFTGGVDGDDLAPMGVQLIGGYISGTLNFVGQRALGDLALVRCLFEKQPNFRNSHFQTLRLTGSKMPGFFAQGIKVDHSLSLVAVKSTKLVTISGAKIGGQLDCHAASFEAVSANSNDTLMAFNAQNTIVATQFRWTNVSVASGHVMLASAHVSDLWDDEKSWPANLILDGFTYNRIYQPAITLAHKRLPWLAKGSYHNGTFTPQPYTHLAKVLREMGHDREARVVLIERERLLALQLEGEMRGELTTARNGEGGDVGRAWIRLRGTQGWHWATGRIAGYGYAPHYALQWAFWAVLVGMMVYFIGYRSGAMVPNSAIILTSTDWAAAYSTDPLRPAWYWSGETAQHFETFYALPYALDVFLPVVDLGQHSAWTQSTATWVGWFLRLFTWALQGAGYLITGLGLAAITG